MSIRPHERPDWQRIETVVLDMDGTLLDLNFDNQVWNECLPRHYAKRRDLSSDDARARVSATLDAAKGSLSWYCLEHWSREFELPLTEVEAELEHLICIRPGVQAFLEFLRCHTARLILATNAHPQSLARKLARTGIGVFFDTIVSAHELGHAKEHDPFWPELARRCEFDPATSLFIDDNQAVLEAARRFGIRYIYGVAQPDSRGRLLTHRGFHSLGDFTELTGRDGSP